MLGATLAHARSSSRSPTTARVQRMKNCAAYHQVPNFSRMASDFAPL